MGVSLTAGWLPGARGRLALTLWQSSEHAPRAVVVVVPPFAEEMNKSRRMFALLGDAIASADMALAAVDVYGTGDSEGQFGEARWSDWKSDVVTIMGWARSFISRNVAVVAVRAGALLALDALDGDEDIGGLVLWSPVLSGRLHLNQFLRVDAAAAVAMGQAQQLSTAQLWRDVESGKPIEVAGYQIHPELATPMCGMELSKLLARRRHSVNWLEVTSDGRPASASVRNAASAIQERGASFELEVVEGDQFWATAEIATAPALVKRTCAIVTQFFAPP